MVVVEIMVAAVNDAPVGSNDVYSVNEDEALVIAAEAGVLANDSDVEGDPLTAVLDVGPEHGTLELNADGSFTYTPNENYFGTDAFTYQISDGDLTSELLVVEITVNPVNDAPVGANDNYALNEDETLSVSAESGVLSNDTDLDGDNIEAVLVGEPEHGVLQLNADGSFSYTPQENYVGPDAFTYQVTDGSLTSEVFVVELQVNGVNDAPVAVGESYEANEDQLLTVDVDGGLLLNDSDVDGDSLTVVMETGPENGVLELNPDGSFTYMPSADFSGPDSFSYRVSDGELTSEVVVVEILVMAGNDAPLGQNDSYVVDEDGTLTVDVESGVLANDSDPDGDALTAAIDNGPQHGTLQLNADGSFTYTPEADYHGPDSFSYLVSDGELSSQVLVELTVTPVNDAPQPGDDAYVANLNETLTIAVDAGVLANDVDADGDTLTVEVVDGPTHGQLTLAADGSFVYEPDVDYIGGDEFTYRVSDGSESAVGVVTLRVRGENERPLANNDVYRVDAGGELTVNADNGVLQNDSDGNDDLLAAVLFRGPENGSLTLNADGSFSYIPNAGFTGLDSFLYRAADDELSSLLAAVTLRVKATIEAPQTPAMDLLPEGESSAVSERERAVDAVWDSLESELLGTEGLEQLLS